ncbi:glycosyltransferase [Microbacterium sp. W1N]|uniref:glycosyltransferase n=1 Tax=Microbacterium festucae TaxID=2977531 RepID=UPI0021BE9DEE|nr:glycosyltransferase [Microbacterium festucae]MCT9821400.1 glycosyltransferase [Microbacterium festucae]
MTRAAAISAVAVVIPAHDEEELLGACLASVAVAALAPRRRGIPVHVWVALDACTDGSARIAAAAGAHLVELDARNVGVARQAGVTAALDAVGDVAPSQVWLAHTDADSVVPANWLTDQLRHARRGAGVVVGTVRPDFRDLSPAQHDAWWQTHTPGVANGHVHGANLGMRADVHLAAGGFAAAAVHEDVMLVAAARAAGARVSASDAAWVRTSGRQAGRAPDGYARYLREDLIPLSKSLPTV